jgi:hypothetical protein
MIELGSKVKDRITPLSGIVIGRAEYLSGSIQYSVQPQECRESKPADPAWLDESRLDVIEHGTGAAKIGIRKN